MARVLHLIASTHRRGAETFAVELADHLRSVGHDVRVMAVAPGDTDAPLPVEVAGTKRVDPAGARRIVDACQWADAVVSFGSISLLTGAIAARMTGKPFVYRNIGDPAVWGAARFAGLRIGAPVRTAERVVALYDGAAHTLISRYRLDPQRVRIIPRGVPHERFHPATDARRGDARDRLGLDASMRWIGFVGALSPEKDPGLLLDAMDHLAEDIGVVIAGTGPLVDQVQSRAERLGTRVHLLGATDDVVTVYDAIDVLALPSTTEGIPGSAVEASLCAVPVVAFDVGGVASVVVDGVTGILSPSREPATYAAALESALDRRAVLGAAARDHVLGRFSMASVGAAWEQVIAEITASGGSTRRAGRVLQITASNERRGAEVFAHQLGVALTNEGWTITTCTVGDNYLPNGLPFRPLGSGRFRPLTLLRLTRQVRRHDIVIVHGGAGLWPSFAASMLMRRPFVYRSIGEPRYWGGVPMGRVRVGIPLRRAARVVALYPQAREQLASMYPIDGTRITVVPNAVSITRLAELEDPGRADVRRQLGISDDTPLIAFLGALSSEKRPQWAVRVVAEHADAHLVVLGRGPLESAVRQQAAELAPGRVHLLGMVERPAEVLVACDLLVLPSTTEGMPASMIEAALLGIPTVATDVGSVAELSRELGAGEVTGPDDYTGFAAAVRRMLDAPHTVRPDPVVAARHDIDWVVHDWSAMLDEVLRERGQRPAPSSPSASRSTGDSASAPATVSDDGPR